MSMWVVVEVGNGAGSGGGSVGCRGVLDASGHSHRHCQLQSPLSPVFGSMWVVVVEVEVGNGADSWGGSVGCREVLHASSLQYPSPVFGSTWVGVEVGWLWSIWVEVEAGW